MRFPTDCPEGCGLTDQQFAVLRQAVEEAVSLERPEYAPWFNPKNGRLLSHGRRHLLDRAWELHTGRRRKGKRDQDSIRFHRYAGRLVDENDVRRQIVHHNGKPPEQSAGSSPAGSASAESGNSLGGLLAESEPAHAVEDLTALLIRATARLLLENVSVPVVKDVSALSDQNLAQVLADVGIKDRFVNQIAQAKLLLQSLGLYSTDESLEEAAGKAKTFGQERQLAIAMQALRVLAERESTEPRAGLVEDGRLAEEGIIALFEILGVEPGERNSVLSLLSGEDCVVESCRRLVA